MAKTTTVSGARKKISAKTPKVIKDTFKGYVVFYREKPGASTYNGGFGFDWMDLKKQDYKKNVGKNKHKKVAGSSPAVSDYHFDSSSNASEFTKLEKEYELAEIDDFKAAKPGEKYYIPWLSLRKNKSPQEIYVQLNIDTIGPGTIKFKPSDARIDLLDQDIITDKKKKGVSHEKLKIKLIATVVAEATIEARFYDKGGKKPDGRVIGKLKIVPNKKEYEFKINFVKVFIIGSIKVVGQKEEIVLDPTTPKATRHKHYTDKIAKLNNAVTKGYPEAIKRMEIILKASNFLTRHGFEAQLAALKIGLAGSIKELAELKKQKIVAEAIDNAQNKNINDFIKKLKNQETFIKNVFGQAMVRYKNLGVHATTIKLEAGDFTKYFTADGIGLYKFNSRYWIRYWQGQEYKFGRLKEVVLEKADALKFNKTQENYIFISPFDVHTSTAHRFRLLGEAESLDPKSNRAIMTPITGMDTVIHEMGHTMGLLHAFSNKNVNFCRGATDNIMDYNYLSKTPPATAKVIAKKTSLFKWQWEIMQKDPQLTVINII